MDSKWVKIPDTEDWDKLPTKIRWDDSTVLVRYSRGDPVVKKYEGIEEERFKNMVKNIEKKDYVQLFMLLCTLPGDSNNMSQIGNSGDFTHNNLDERFDYYCQNCEKETKFQIRNKYQGLRCSCIMCNSKLSVIKHDCSDCNSESLFVKPVIDTDKDYACHNCSKSLYDENDV